MTRNAQSGRPPSDAPEVAPWSPERWALGAPEAEPWDADAEGASEAAGAALARASDAEAESPTAKRRVVVALTASPEVVVPEKVTVAV